MRNHLQSRLEAKGITAVTKRELFERLSVNDWHRECAPFQPTYNSVRRELIALINERSSDPARTESI